MYVVRRPFRNCGQMMLPGSPVEPGNIKWFKTRLKDRYIVEVNAHNFDEWNKYFVGKFGIELKLENSEEATPDTEEDFVPEDVAPEAPAVPEATVVKKVVATVKA